MRYPFYKKTHKAWYCSIGDKEIRLGADKDEAIKEYHKLRSAEIPVPTRTPAAQFIDQFLEWTKNIKPPRTFEWYRDHSKSFAKNCYKLTVNAVKPPHLERRNANDGDQFSTAKDDW